MGAFKNILLVVFLYVPQLTALGFAIKTIALLPLAVGAYCAKKRPALPKNIALLVWYPLVLLFLQLNLGLVYDGFSLFILKQSVIYPLFLITAFYITQETEKQREKLRLHVVYYTICWVLLTNSLIILGQATSKGFAQFTAEIFIYTDLQLKYMYSDDVTSRFSGMAPSGFTSLSVSTVMLQLIIFYGARIKIINRIFALATILLATAAQMYVARTGFYLSGPVSIWAIVQLARIRISVIILPIFVIIAWYVYDSLTETMRDFLGEISQLFSDKPEENNTLHYLRQYYVMPEFSIFGDGMLDRSEGSIDSDVGWIRILSGLGLLGAALYIAHLLSVLLFIKKSARRAVNIATAMIAVLTLVNFKDFVLIQHGAYQVLTLFAALAYSERGSDFARSQTPISHDEVRLT